MKIYLAARYSRREELCVYRKQLINRGHEVQARWLDGEHQIANDGKPIGEHGEALVEGTLRSGEVLSEHEQTERAAALRTSFATDDWDDVNAAEVVICFTEPPRSTANRGGRHVEYGIALANRARVIVVGYRENIFHWLPQVEFCATWEEALALCSTGDRRAKLRERGSQFINAAVLSTSPSIGEIATRLACAELNNPAQSWFGEKVQTDRTRIIDGWLEIARAFAEADKK